MKEEYEIGTKWNWSTGTTTTWKIVSNESNLVWLEQEGNSEDRISYDEVSFEELVTKGRFKEIPGKTKTLKKSDIIAMIKKGMMCGLLNGNGNMDEHAEMIWNGEEVGIV